MQETGVAGGKLSTAYRPPMLVTCLADSSTLSMKAMFLRNVGLSA
jgi:hypothetical protein